MDKAKRLLNVLVAMVGSAILFSVAAVTCAAQSPIEYAVPTNGSDSVGIVKGPDGNLWFTELNGNKIGKITPSGTITEYLIPTGSGEPDQIALGPDGNLWFAEFGGNRIAKLATSGAVTEYIIPTSGAVPGGMAAGPDGNLWFTEQNGNKIGKITIAGAITEYPIPTSGADAGRIAAGPDGNLWFTENGGHKVGRITPSGAITEYATPTSGSAPIGIAAGPDGNIWFTEGVAGKIGKITPGGVSTEYPVPTVNSGPNAITAGPDGNLWFTEGGGIGKIGKITPGGTITEYLIPTSGSGPGGITTGPDGNIWFTESNGNNIGLLYPYGQVFAHLAMGALGSDVWTTAIILNNTTGSPASFTVDFFQDNGQPLPLGLGIYNETHQASVQQTQNGQAILGTITAGGSVTEVLSSGTFVEGWATLSGPGVAGQVVFHRHTSTGADYEATVPLSMGGTEFRVPFDETSFFNGSTPVASLPYITGMALASLDPSLTTTVSCAIIDPNGLSLGTAAPIVIPPMGHTALQLNAASGFGNVPGTIGSLDCTSGGPLFAVLGLRFLGVNDLTSFAAVKVH